MKLTLKIKNFGKLENATIQVNNLTILAGKNNSGKSFISKALYSFLSAVNTNYIPEIKQKITSLYLILVTLKANIPRLGQEDKKFIEAFHNLLGSLTAIDNTKFKFLAGKLVAINEIKPIINEQIALFNFYKNQLKTKKSKFARIKEPLDDLESQLHQLKRLLESPLDVFTENLTTDFETSLKENFQVSTLEQLKKVNTTEPLNLTITDLVEIRLANEQVTCSIQPSSLDRIQDISRVIYIESPIYWKLKSALESIDRTLLKLKLEPHQYLTGIPQYFHDLVTLLRLQPIGSPKFDEITQEIEQEIGGQLKLTHDGNLIFQEQKTIHPIAITALGVANLGMLAMLLKKNLIDPGTFLFIDEPEAHLHPAWQVVFIRALYQLAKADINIIIATHSVDIIKYIEVLTKDDPQAQSRIALNHLSSQGISCDEPIDFYEKLKQIKQELTEPFYELYLEGL